MRSNKCDVCFSHKETFRIKYIWTRRGQSFGKPSVNSNVNVTDCIDRTRTCRVNWDVSDFDKFFCAAKVDFKFLKLSHQRRTIAARNVTRTDRGRVYLKQTLYVNPTTTCWKTTHWYQLYSSKNQTFKKFNRSWIIRGHWTWRRSH